MGSWENRTDPLAAKFFSKALKNFRKNLANPSTASDPTTVATTFVLATHEALSPYPEMLTLDI